MQQAKGRAGGGAALRAVRAGREGLFVPGTGQKVALWAAAVWRYAQQKPPVGRFAANRGQPTQNPYGVGTGNKGLSEG